MKEELIKLNDYTLVQKTEASDTTRSGAGYGNGLKVLSQTTRTFNFLAAQLTTTTRDVAYEGRGGDAGGSTDIATQTFIQNFDDMQSGREVAHMHAQLIELGGKPPPLEEITGNISKKGSVGSLRNG